ncbi:permease prefix domain 2-containing transporter [Catalinimonas niigatensis]|uniref:permease prefix domain 2-containing transporter n=1 Tax=Catalinimonas niigatensis TaxID=1397264 RepID=UPI00389951E3
MIKRLADRLFRWFCLPDYYDEIVGDLEEIYQRNQDDEIRFAQWMYLFQIFGLFRPSLIRSFPQHLLIHPVCLETTSKSALATCSATNFLPPSMCWDWL